MTGQLTPSQIVRELQPRFYADDADQQRWRALLACADAYDQLSRVQADKAAQSNTLKRELEYFIEDVKSVCEEKSPIFQAALALELRLGIESLDALLSQALFTREQVDQEIAADRAARTPGIIGDLEVALVSLATAADHYVDAVMNSGVRPGTTSVRNALAVAHHVLKDLPATVMAAPAASKERCICAAIQLKTGAIIRGHRHDSCFLTAMRIPGVGKAGIREAEQGFITSTNRFVDRREGMRLQKAAGIESITGYRGDILFPEDLY